MLKTVLFSDGGFLISDSREQIAYTKAGSIPREVNGNIHIDSFSTLSIFSSKPVLKTNPQWKQKYR